MSSLKSLIFWLALTTLAIGVSAKPPQKITNGDVAYQKQFPYLASLRHSKSGQHFCGASIITSHHLVTAAHCLTNESIHDFYAVVGTNNRYYYGWIYRIQNFVMHEDYTDAPYYLYDIAIIKLKRALERDSSWETIPIATKDYQPGSNSFASGWGLTSQGRQQWLRFIQVPIADMSKCAGPHNAKFLKTIKVCVISTYGKGICNGDSGGPLVVEGELVGITSTADCGKRYNFFTKVYAFRDFIQRETGLTVAKK